MNGFSRLGLLSLASLPALIFPAPASDPDAAPEVRRLIKQLGDDEFAKREEASKRLTEIGEPALDAVTKAATSSDPEVRRRAADIVAVIDDNLHPEHCFTGGRNWVRQLCVSADGKRVLTCGYQKMRLWDATTGACLRDFEEDNGTVVSAALSLDGKCVVSGSWDGTVRLWDATTGKELRCMRGYTNRVFSVCFGPEGKALATGDLGNLDLLDLNTGKRVAVFHGHTGDVRYVRTVAYSDTARLAATGGDDTKICLWDLERGKKVRTLTGHYGLVTCVRFSPDGKQLLSSSSDGTIRFWNVESGKELKRIQEQNASCVAFSLDGKRIVTGDWNDKVVRVWAVETGQEVRRYEGHTDAVVSVAFFPDGKRIASASSEDGTVRIWRAPR